MNTVHVLTGLEQPRLHIWRDRTAQSASELAYDAEPQGLDLDGLTEFRALLDSQLHGDVHALLHVRDDWEKPEHRKTFPRGAQYQFPDDLWLAHGAARVLAENPFTASRDRVRLHLITSARYRDGQLYVWSPHRPDRRVAAAGVDADGPYFDLDLDGRDRHLFLFKFMKVSGDLEPDYANRLWSARDGGEIWVHSESAPISSRPPVKDTLVVHSLFPVGAADAELHVWQEHSDFAQTSPGSPVEDGWMRFEQPIYTELPYRFMFRNAGVQPEWEHPEARRNVFLRDGATWTIDGDGSERQLGPGGAWTLEGDHEVFGAKPRADKEVVLEIAAAAPASALSGPITLDVWVNRARGNTLTGLAAGPDGRWTFSTYPEVVTSFRFRSGEVAERVERHTLKIGAADTGAIRRAIVLGRAEPLARAPVADLFVDPPFPIERPGAWIAGDRVRFAVHCPLAASVEIIGEWTGWQGGPVAMRSTRDGTYWWAEVPVVTITGALSRPNVHGVLYKFALNQVRLVQDPAADWVENSDPSRASKLVDHRLYAWRSNAWARPSWEYLTVYQLHPSRFSRRGGASGLAAVTRELTDSGGYLRKLNATAILLMPICEFAGDQGWGYNPSFFYSVESSYGGPDALKALVDAAHERGMAVLLDVVFNHAGASDNVLWAVANESFFDGDTEWGAMINFDHPQVTHFFAQNLVHFMKNYRVDGFRFDFTRVIRHGGEWTYFVKTPGSGGGWAFMKRLQAATRAVDGRCLMMAENYPNEWDLTRPPGPMDTQWGDDFHDRLVDAARGWDVMSRLADAIKTSHVQCERWHEVTCFPESHDEVGNVPDRIVNVAGLGQGLRRNKVAAAATLFSRGIPLWFMGAESGECRQFQQNSNDALDLDAYERDVAASRVRAWWNKLCELRRGNNRIEGPASVRVHYAQDGMVAFSRGEGAEWFVVLNWSDRGGERSLAALNLPGGEYKELLNSSWGSYQVEWEDEHPNGGWDARLRREYNVNVPDYGAVILERR
jgi:1,4-alpha-glucan branching enzyme